MGGSSGCSASGAAYGSILEPTTWGSGGGLGDWMRQWPTGFGRSYQVQSATSPHGATWQDYDVPVAGTGGMVSLSYPIGAETQRFFRVQVQ